MHIEISLLKEAERVERTKNRLIWERGRRYLRREEVMLMGSSCAERRRCRWGFLVLGRRCKSVFHYIY
jgi:hypothetical protein